MTIQYNPERMTTSIQQIGESFDSSASGNGSLVGILKYVRTLVSDVKSLLAGTLNVTITNTPTVTLSSQSLIPNVYKSIDALAINSEATLWTPASGKKFRLMGGLVTCTGAAGNVTLKDGNNGSTVLMIPNTLVGTPIPLSLGDGVLSSTANNNLRAVGTTLQVLNGTIWGREE